MKNTGNLKVTAPTDREIVMTRVFDAPRHLVYEAYTRPELLQRWLGVFGDWTMPVCEVDLRVGGSYRYLWRGKDGAGMGVRGVFREILPAERIVCTEQFDDAWYEGEALNTTLFAEQGGRTTLTLSVLYSSKAVRDAVLRTPMEHGVATSFDTMAGILAEMPQGVR
jgi:uncharacterized protein YndB with AHSA1/START domain